MSRAEERRAEKAQALTQSGSLKLNGGEVVVAVACNGIANAEGQRPYQTWVRGPATEHTNAEMVQLLAMLATTIVLGNAQGGKISVQQSIDECKVIFGRSLEGHVHRAISGGHGFDNLTTVPMARNEAT